MDEAQDLDEIWIKDFEENDKNYEIFYSDDIYYVKIHCIYIDKVSNISQVKEEKIFLLNPNCISREEILSILKRNSIQNSVKYSVMSILKYNIDIEPLDIKNFLEEKEDSSYSFLTPIKNIDAITFKKTISMFHDLNNLFVIFYEKDKTHMITRENITKKVYISHGNKKTIRKNL